MKTLEFQIEFISTHLHPNLSIFSKILHLNIMDLFLSIFDSKCRCNNCGRGFKLLSKRRKCIICSISYIELLYCKNCSIKLAGQNLFFRSKRYCLICFTLPSSPKFVPILQNKVESFEEAAAEIGLPAQELLIEKEKVQELVKTFNEGIRSLPTTSSVFFI